MRHSGTFFLQNQLLYRLRVLQYTCIQYWRSNKQLFESSIVHIANFSFRISPLKYRFLDDIKYIANFHFTFIFVSNWSASIFGSIVYKLKLNDDIMISENYLALP